MLNSDATSTRSLAQAASTWCHLRPFLIALAAGVFLSSPLHAASFNAASTITAVTVFPDGALITREANLTVPTGEHEVAIANLPSRLIESSLRISGASQGNVVLGSTEIKKQIARDVVNPREEQLREELTQFHTEKQIVLDRLQAAEDQLAYIRAMATSAGDEQQPSSYLQLPIDQWEVAWQTLQSATERTQKAIREARSEIQEIDKSIQQKTKQLNEIATHQKATRQLTLQLSSSNEAALTLKLRYQIRGAQWAPAYEADLSTENQTLALSSLALVSQRTGEDWSGVSLTVSTLRPAASTELPELAPWVIDLQSEAMQSRRLNKSLYSAPMADNTMMDSKANAFSADEMAAPEPKKAMVQQMGTLVQAPFSAAYKIAGKVTVNSGSDRRRLALDLQELDAELQLASVPRLDPRAVLLATTHFASDSPLLPGAVSLHRDGSFVGNSRLPLVQPGEELSLSFGEDDRVKISFVPEPEQKGNEGLLFGKRKKITKNYHFHVISQHEQAYNIRLLDNFPIAASDEIEVRHTGEKPTRIDEENKKGVAVWERQLEPGKPLDFNYGYEITYPKDQILIGL